jgi:steroid 5-alpha reductase family enzyme
MWSLTFMFPNAVILYAQHALNMPITVRSMVSNACISVWAIRLAAHIGARHKEEDYRYVEIRKRLSTHGQFWYYIKSYFYIFIMQATFSLIVNAATLYITAYRGVEVPLGWRDYAGWGIFAVGFLMEAASDWQLTKHLADKDPNKGKFCKRGFWRYSRHPNYFGEAMIWWGLYLSACSLPSGLWYFFSPLFMTLLLRYVSGVAMLERKQRKHPEFAQYEAETSAFIPWFWNEVDPDKYRKQD